LLVLKLKSFATAAELIKRHAPFPSPKGQGGRSFGASLGLPTSNQPCAIKGGFSLGRSEGFLRLERGVGASFIGKYAFLSWDLGRKLYKFSKKIIATGGFDDYD
jgi:hypothetical protein